MENITNDFLLFLMLSFYLFPIIYVYMYYDNNPSISNIISNDDSKYIILFFMILMGITTILYECKRNDIYSIIIISILLISIYILIYFTEEHILHYIFASIAFICSSKAALSALSVAKLFSYSCLHANNKLLAITTTIIFFILFIFERLF